MLRDIDSVFSRAPLGFAAYTGAPAQLWSLAPSSAAAAPHKGKLLDSKDKQCLNVVSFTGPDVGLDPCKPAGARNDGNEIMHMGATTHDDNNDSAPFQILNGGKCLAASRGPKGGDLYTVDTDGTEYKTDDDFAAMTP